MARQFSKQYPASASRQFVLSEANEVSSAGCCTHTAVEACSRKFHKHNRQHTTSSRRCFVCGSDVLQSLLPCLSRLLNCATTVSSLVKYMSQNGAHLSHCNRHQGHMYTAHLLGGTYRARAHAHSESISASCYKTAGLSACHHIAGNDLQIWMGLLQML